MSAPINDGGPAFPAPMFIRHAGGEPMCPQEFGLGGMTLRDYFAGQALAEAYREAVCFAQTRKNGEHEREDGSRYTIIPREIMTARTAYCLADAMLAARERKEDDK